MRTRDCTCHLQCARPGHDHHFFLRRDLNTGKPLEAVIWAVWMGGFAEVGTFDWNATGLAQAQRWCDRNGAIWHHNGLPVRPDSLHVHANAT